MKYKVHSSPMERIRRMTTKKPIRNPKCDGKRCWICEKAGVVVSKDFHDFVMEGIKLRSSYFLAFTSLARFLIGDKADRIYNTCAKPDYNGRPSDAVREIVANFNLAAALRANQDRF